MRVQSICFTLLASLSLTPTQAQDLLACVDPDVKQALLFQGIDASRSVSRTVPDSFQGLTPPAGFEFIGSAVSDLQTIVGYKSGLASDAALESALNALESDGWSAIRNPGMSRGGFVNDTQPAYAMVCRDDEMMTVMARQSESVAYINLNLVSHQGDFNCNAMPQAQSGSVAAVNNKPLVRYVN